MQATEVSGRVSGAVTLDPISPAYSATWLPVGPTFTSFTDTHIPHERAVLAAFPLSAFPGSAPSAALKPSLTSEAATRLLGTARALCREKAGEGPRTQSHCLLAPRPWTGIGLGVCVSRCRDGDPPPAPHQNDGPTLRPVSVASRGLTSSFLFSLCWFAFFFRSCGMYWMELGTD